jgi:hypothetical protein
MPALAEQQGMTTQDYIFCEDCQCMVDFYKYNHDLKDAGHDGCRWRYVTPEELEECVKECQDNYARCPHCDALVDFELDHNENKCGCCGNFISRQTVKWVNCFTDE